MLGAQTFLCSLHCQHMFVYIQLIGVYFVDGFVWICVEQKMQINWLSNSINRSLVCSAYTATATVYRFLLFSAFVRIINVANTNTHRIHALHVSHLKQMMDMNATRSAVVYSLIVCRHTKLWCFIFYRGTLVRDLDQTWITIQFIKLAPLRSFGVVRLYCSTFLGTRMHGNNGMASKPTKNESAAHVNFKPDCSIIQFTFSGFVSRIQT